MPDVSNCDHLKFAHGHVDGYTNWLDVVVQPSATLQATWGCVCVHALLQYVHIDTASVLTYDYVMICMVFFYLK